MLTMIFVPAILLFVAVSLVLRLIIRPIWNPYRIRRPYYGPYGYYGYGRGYRRHRFGWFLPIVVLAPLHRIFRRRW